MKQKIIGVIAFILLACSFLIVLDGQNNAENKIGFANVKKAIDHFFTGLNTKKAFSKKSYYNHTADSLLLLYSEQDTHPTFVKAWKHVAQELGIHLDILSDSDFLELRKNPYRGIILADSIHADINTLLAKKLISYVANGGKLMLVFDAATDNSYNTLSKSYPLMSELLGISCGNTPRDKCQQQTSTIGNTRQQLLKLGFPPGKCTGTDDSLTSFCAISSVEYGVLNYPHYIINNNGDQSPLLTTQDNQLIAGVKPFGQGQVLFINLPITYLWSQTDALFIHVFLQYFANNLLQLPRLAAVPNGIGGLIMNLHVESIDALVGLKKLQDIGFFKQKPYSIDFTAGPGLDNSQDHLGLDVLNNQTTQRWMHFLSKLGHAIGSDGGWMHNYYCLHANENNEAEFKNYLALNNQAINKVLNTPVQEYVPSCGVQPHWATRFLEQQKFLGYYTTGNTGTAPTQNFRNGIFDAEQLWSFPVLPFEKGASLRDFGRIGFPEEAISAWMRDVVTFVSTTHTSRLIYFHPPDILFFPQYLNSLTTLMNLTHQLQNQSSYQWYTMVDLAQFLNQRRQVSWHVTYDKRQQIIKAHHPINLKDQAWLVLKKTCDKPVITVGHGIVNQDNQFWIITASQGTTIEFNCNWLKRGQ